MTMWAGAGLADPIDVHRTAQAMYDRLPDVMQVEQIEGVCGADDAVNRSIAFCTTDNVVLLASGFVQNPAASYEMAHVLGHAVQVRHGIADLALRAIRARPSEEEALRGLVTRQVECLAGVFLARSGVAMPNLGALYQAEPFTGSHWGRDPLRVGPKVSIGLQARIEWVRTGYDAGDVAVCSAGELSSGLLVAGQRSD